MSAAEDWLRNAGAVKVNLMVRPANSEALTFYQKLGYEEADVAVLARWLVEDVSSKRV